MAPLVTIDKVRKVRLVPSGKDGEGDPAGYVFDEKTEETGRTGNFRY